MLNSRCILFFLIILNQGIIFAGTDKFPKDTLYYMSGERIPAIVIDTSFYGVKILTSNPKKLKKKEQLIEGEYLFAIHFSNGKEKVIYRQDTVIENYLTVDQARLYVQGAYEGLKMYHATLPFWLSTIIGMPSGLYGGFGNFISPIPPFVYGSLASNGKVRVRDHEVSKPELKDDPYFMLGYESSARRKKAASAFKGGFVGLIAGLAISNIFIIQK